MSNLSLSVCAIFVSFVACISPPFMNPFYEQIQPLYHRRGRGEEARVLHCENMFTVLYDCAHVTQRLRYGRVGLE